MDSIMQDARECYITGNTNGLHKHHIFFGNPLRQISAMNGFWVFLRHDWHNGENYGVYADRELDLRLKRECQEKYEEEHTRAEFRSIIGNSYL